MPKAEPSRVRPLEGAGAGKKATGGDASTSTLFAIPWWACKTEKVERNQKTSIRGEGMGGTEIEREKGERKNERTSPAVLTGGNVPVTQVGTTCSLQARPKRALQKAPRPAPHAPDFSTHAPSLPFFPEQQEALAASSPWIILGGSQLFSHHLVPFAVLPRTQGLMDVQSSPARKAQAKSMCFSEAARSSSPQRCRHGHTKGGRKGQDLRLQPLTLDRARGLWIWLRAWKRKESIIRGAPSLKL